MNRHQQVSKVSEVSKWAMRPLRPVQYHKSHTPIGVRLILGTGGLGIHALMANRLILIPPSTPGVSYWREAKHDQGS
jgi:hypothetical protein